MADSSTSKPEYNTNIGQNLRPISSYPNRSSTVEETSAANQAFQDQPQYSADDIRGQRTTVETSEQGMPINPEESSRQSIERREGNKTDAEPKEKNKKITPFFIGTIVTIALVFDAIELITGGFIGILTTPVAGLLFYTMFKSKDVNMKSSVRMGAMILGPIINVIPLVGALPGWVAQVLTIIASVKAEEKLGIK